MIILGSITVASLIFLLLVYNAYKMEKQLCVNLESNYDNYLEHTVKVIRNLNDVISSERRRNSTHLEINTAISNQIVELINQVSEDELLEYMADHLGEELEG